MGVRADSTITVPTPIAVEAQDLVSLRESLLSELSVRGDSSAPFCFDVASSAFCTIPVDVVKAQKHHLRLPATGASASAVGVEGFDSQSLVGGSDAPVALSGMSFVPSLCAGALLGPLSLQVSIHSRLPGSCVRYLGTLFAPSVAAILRRALAVEAVERLLFSAAGT